MKAKQLTLISTMATSLASCISIVGIASIANIVSIVSIVSVANNTNVSALTYQTTINPEFTINPAISVSLSSADLVINDLEPGTTKDSNIITVTVSTNNASGYTLGSTVGNSTTYNYDALKNNVDNTKSFTNLTSAGSLTAGKWGYSYSNDNGTNWSTYNGLPLYTSTPVEIASSSSASTTNTQFKIGAYATTGQAAGEYNNVVNFIATASPEPVVNMQTVTASDLATLMPNVGDTTTLADARDDQEYAIAKLADNKYWMTENLNLAGGTALSADNTNVTSAYISSFTTSNNLTKNGNTIVLPASSTSGFGTDNYSYVYNSGNKTNCGASGQNTPCYSYYSWDAATLGSGRSLSTDNTDAEQSICPKGWKLPSTYNGSGTAAAATDFRALMIGYGGSDSIQSYTTATNPTGATMYSNIGPGSTPNFLLAGYYTNGSFYSGGSYGYYWSSTSYPHNYFAHDLDFNSTSVGSADSYRRLYGNSVRCLFSE